MTAIRIDVTDALDSELVQDLANAGIVVLSEEEVERAAGRMAAEILAENTLVEEDLQWTTDWEPHDFEHHCLPSDITDLGERAIKAAPGGTL